VNQTASTGDVLKFQKSGVDRLVISNAGNVGIGTTQPLQALHVLGTAQATLFSGSGASLTALDAGNVSSGTLAVARGGTGTTTSTGTGSVVLSASPTLTGTVTGGTFSGSGASLTTLNVDNVSSGTLAVARGGTGAATLTSSKVLVGNGTTAVLQPSNLHWDNVNSRLGINATSPSQALHVVGDTRIEGNLTVNGMQTFIDTNTQTTEQVIITNDGTGPALVVNQKGAQPILEFQDDGVPVMKIINDGNVGIGTTLPQQKLHVQGTVQATTFSGSGASLTALDAGNVSTGTLAVARGGTGAATLTSGKVLVGNGTTAVLQPTNLHWDNVNSRLGISTISPSQPFHVVGNIYTQSDLHANGVTFQGVKIMYNASDYYGSIIGKSLSYSSPNYTIHSDNSNRGMSAVELAWRKINFYTYGAALTTDLTTTDISPYIRMTIDSLGNVGIGTTIPLQKLHVQGNILSTGSTSAGTQFLGLATDAVATPSFSWTGDTNTGMYRPGTDMLGLVTAGVERVSVLANGNVGIGTTNPLQKLHVNGRTIFGGEILGNMEVRYGGNGSGTTTFKLNNNGIDSGSPQGPILGVDGPGFFATAFIDTYTGGVSSPTPLALRVQGTERMRILDNGNVGIGTATPPSKLSLYSLTSSKLLSLSTGTGNGTGIATSIGNPMLGLGGLPFNAIVPYYYGIGFGYNAGTDLHPTEIGFVARNNAGGTIGDFYIATRANTTSTNPPVQRMCVTSGGNVGIGTTNPQANLHVEGKVYSVGGIVETVTYTTNLVAGFSTTLGTPQNTNFTVIITPKRVSSKILITFSSQMTFISNGSNGGRIYVYRNGSSISHGYGTYFQPGYTAYSYQPTFFTHEDSPASTSSQTYTIYISSDGGYIFGFHQNSKITLVAQEIGA
jgi:hypothetical protein